MSLELKILWINACLFIRYEKQIFFSHFPARFMSQLRLEERIFCPYYDHFFSRRVLWFSLKKISHWTPFTLKRYNLDEACVRLDLGEKRGIQIFRFLHMSIITSPFDLETFCWRPIHTLYLKVYVPYRYSMSQIG